MPLSLDDWIRERHETCLRLAEQKAGAEREGWLEDAAYFSRAMTAIGALRSLVKTWEEPGPTGELYEMPRILRLAKSALREILGNPVKAMRDVDPDTNLFFKEGYRDGLAGKRPIAPDETRHIFQRSDYFAGYRAGSIERKERFSQYGC